MVMMKKQKEMMVLIKKEKAEKEKQKRIIMKNLVEKNKTTNQRIKLTRSPEIVTKLIIQVVKSPTKNFGNPYLRCQLTYPLLCTYEWLRFADYAQNWHPYSYIANNMTHESPYIEWGV